MRLLDGYEGYLQTDAYDGYIKMCAREVTRVGRKSYLFCDSVAGTNVTANLYSLIEMAKANGIEPYRYLRHVFTELPKAVSIEDIEALLPHFLE